MARRFSNGRASLHDALDVADSPGSAGSIRAVTVRAGLMMVQMQRLTPVRGQYRGVIGLRGGQSVAAIITNESARSLKRAPGTSACAIYKASSVILGVTP